MKKSILNIALLLSIFSVALSSCSKDDTDKEIAKTTNLPEGKYTVIMDGKTIASGTTIEVGWLQTMASMSEGEDFTVLVANVPEEVGGVFNFNATSSTGTVTIMGKNLLLNNGSEELYFSSTGFVKRESSTKISFQGTCSAMLSTESHTFSGTLESDAYKIVIN